MSDAEAIRRPTDGGPMTLDIIAPMGARPTPEEIERDPETFWTFTAARLRFLDLITRGTKPRCLTCDEVAWTPDPAQNTARLAGITVMTTMPEFRDTSSPENWPMLAHGICEHCARDRTTLRERVLNAYRTSWPNMNSSPATSFGPTSSSGN